MTESQKRAKSKYRKDKCICVQIQLYPTEADIIQHLYEQESKSGYIKRLIREDIEKSK